MVLGRPSVRVCVLLVAVDHKNRACILLVQSQNVVVLQYSPINTYCGMVTLWLMLSPVSTAERARACRQASGSSGSEPLSAYDLIMHMQLPHSRTRDQGTRTPLSRPVVFVVFFFFFVFSSSSRSFRLDHLPSGATTVSFFAAYLPTLSPAQSALPAPPTRSLSWTRTGRDRSTE